LSVAKINQYEYFFEVECILMTKLWENHKHKSLYIQVSVYILFRTSIECNI